MYYYITGLSMYFIFSVLSKIFDALTVYLTAKTTRHEKVDKAEKKSLVWYKNFE